MVSAIYISLSVWGVTAVSQASLLDSYDAEWEWGIGDGRIIRKGRNEPRVTLHNKIYIIKTPERVGEVEKGD